MQVCKLLQHNVPFTTPACTRPSCGHQQRQTSTLAQDTANYQSMIAVPPSFINPTQNYQIPAESYSSLIKSIHTHTNTGLMEIFPHREGVFSRGRLNFLMPSRKINHCILSASTDSWRKKQSRRFGLVAMALHAWTVTIRRAQLYREGWAFF